MGYKMEEFRNNSLYERVNKLLVSFEWSDCTFSVSGKKFKAHKLILGISSPVFEAMFYGPLSSNNDIVITDIEPDVFQLLLNYIYTDKVTLASVEEALELLYVSRKYLLDCLSEMCIKYVQSNISIDNVITILNYPDYMLDKQLASASLQLFCEHASYLLQENRKHISSSCLQKILICNNINISEKQLIKFVFEWTTIYCEANNISIDLKHRREVLIKNGLLKLLRFFTLSIHDIDEIVSDANNLLLPQESESIKRLLKESSIVNDRSIIDKFSAVTVQRNFLKLKWYLCHRSLVKSTMPVIIDSSHNFIQCRFRANKSIFINYFNIPSRTTPAVNYCNNTPKQYYEHLSITLQCEYDKSVIIHHTYKDNIEYDSNIDIEFVEPCFIKKDYWYKICFLWPKFDRFNTYSYGIQCRDKVYNSNKIHLEFEDLLAADNWGSFLRGLKFCI